LKTREKLALPQAPARFIVKPMARVYNAFMPSVNLTDHFLIAMPNMVDPHFARTLTYVCEHNDQGALGLVVNRPIDMTLSALLAQVSVPHTAIELQKTAVHFGGPVQVDRGFVLHEPVGDWQSTLAVNDRIGLTTSKDILVAVGNGEGPRKLLVTLGYAGWAPGQLENELSQNAWLTVQAAPEVIFDLPFEERLPAAMQLLGIDYASLSEQAGHA
jgi:putative transcriptional regulator